jgi:hypothetical protein
MGAGELRNQGVKSRRETGDFPLFFGASRNGAEN